LFLCIENKTECFIELFIRLISDKMESDGMQRLLEDLLLPGEHQNENSPGEDDIQMIAPEFGDQIILGEQVTVGEIDTVTGKSVS
jgi:hypothetical protein